MTISAAFVKLNEKIKLTRLFWFCTITSSFWQDVIKQWLINDKSFATIQDLIHHNWFEAQSFENKKNPSQFFTCKIFHLGLSNTR